MKVRKKETQNGEITSDNNLGFIIIRSDFSINLLNQKLNDQNKFIFPKK